MKKVLVLLLTLTSMHTAWCQKDVPSFGKIDKADLELKTCDFETDAEAYELLDLGNANFILTGNLSIETEYRIRIKILKDKGVERANIRIRFYSRNGYETIDEVSGFTYNLDAGGNIVKSKLEKNNIYTQKITDYRSEVVFTLPNVKAGSVIEYKYKKIRKGFSRLDPWYFQSTIPSRFSQYSVSVPQYFDFTYQGHRTLPLDIKDDGISTHPDRVFTMRNIPSLKNEPYMSAPDDYLQHIEFQLSAINIPGEPTRDLRTTWLKLNTELLEDEDFGIQLHKNIPHTPELDAQLAKLQQPFDKMQAVYNHVRKNMNCNGGGFYSNLGVKSAWDKKTGNNGDINLMLVNLLRDAGLTAYPLLISTRDNGHVNTAYPFLEQFNTVEAYVVLDDKSYVLDGTDKYNPARLIPYDAHYTEGFIVDKKKYGWVTLVDNESKYRIAVTLNGQVDEQGLLTAEANIFNYDYSKNLRSKKLKENPEQFKEQYFTKAYTSLKIDSITYKNIDDDTLPLIQNLHFTSALNNSGEYNFFNPNLFLGLETNPFLAEHRFTDVDFGYGQSYLITGMLKIPDTYELDALPKNIRMIMPDTSVSLQRVIQVQENTINYRISLEFNRPIYYLDEYDDFREFYKKLFALLNEQIIIKKKTKA